MSTISTAAISSKPRQRRRWWIGALMFGVLGYVFRKCDIPKAPLIFGLILGEKVEQSFRQAMTISGGDPIVFLKSPLAVGLLALAATTVLFSFWAKRKSAATLAQAAASGAPQP